MLNLDLFLYYIVDEIFYVTFQIFQLESPNTIPNTITVSQNITTDVTWETGKTYILEARISVESYSFSLKVDIGR